MANKQHQWASNPNRGPQMRPAASAPHAQPLTLRILLMNRLFHAQNHRLHAAGLLRQILHERAIRQAASLRDEDHRFG